MHEGAISSNEIEQMPAKKVSQEDLLAHYLALDPTGEYFLQNGITWSSVLDEPVGTVILCEDISMERLLGERPDVPKVDPDYVPLKDQVDGINIALQTRNNFALSGPPGSSKTSVIEYTCAVTNRPFYVADLHEDYRPEVLRGHTIATRERTTKFVDGPITKAMSNPGAVFLADEANLAPPGTLAAMHRPLAGYEIYLEEDGNRMVEMSRGVTMCVACNALNSTDDAHLYSGIQRMNIAFLDRLGVTINTSYPEPNVELDIVWKSIARHFDISGLSPATQIHTKDVVSKMIKSANSIRDHVLRGAVETSFSIRKTITWAKTYIQTNSLQKSTLLAVLNAQDKNEAAMLETCIKGAFGNDYTNQCVETFSSLENDKDTL